eukprot:9305523-Pyramimonas_sp.AAC.1
MRSRYTRMLTLVERVVRRDEGPGVYPARLLPDLFGNRGAWEDTSDATKERQLLAELAWDMQGFFCRVAAAKWVHDLLDSEDQVEVADVATTFYAADFLDRAERILAKVEKVIHAIGAFASSD